MSLRVSVTAQAFGKGPLAVARVGVLVATVGVCDFFEPWF